jgi:hypothetical protein
MKRKYYYAIIGVPGTLSTIWRYTIFAPNLLAARRIARLALTDGEVILRLEQDSAPSTPIVSTGKQRAAR